MPWLEVTFGQKLVASSHYLALLRVLTESQNFFSLSTLASVIGCERLVTHLRKCSLGAPHSPSFPETSTCEHLPEGKTWIW